MVSDNNLNIQEEKNDSIEYTQPLVFRDKSVQFYFILQPYIFLQEGSKTFSQRIKDCFGIRPLDTERLIQLNGKTNAKRFPPNIVKNQKYSTLTFIPLVLYNQFRFFFNLFYLLIALTQFIPALVVGKTFQFPSKPIFIQDLCLPMLALQASCLPLQ